MRPKISVIVSLYRGERYLERFLQNIVQQKWFDDIEFVIDHNEPSEAELTMLKEFERAHPGRLKHLVRERVVPYGSSWNRCIREASSDIVAIWNVDDVRTPDSLWRQAQPILADEADLVFGNHIEVGGHGKTEGRRVQIASTPPYLYSRSMVFGPFFMFRKSLCEKAGYVDEQLRASADYDLAIRLSFHARVKALDVDLGYYLMERKGLSTRANTRRFVEDTVIGLRYGNYDQLYYESIPKALRYEIRKIKCDGQWLHVSQYVPDYQLELRKRVVGSMAKGPLNYVRLQAFRYRKTVARIEGS